MQAEACRYIPEYDSSFVYLPRENVQAGSCLVLFAEYSSVAELMNPTIEYSREGFDVPATYDRAFTLMLLPTRQISQSGIVGLYLAPWFLEVLAFNNAAKLFEVALSVFQSRFGVESRTEYRQTIRFL